MLPTRSHCRRRFGGYTLLEVILAMMLAMVLLSALWVAMRVNLKLFESGRGHVEQAQLARALLRQINDDIQNAVIPPAGEPDRTVSAVGNSTIVDQGNSGQHVANGGGDRNGIVASGGFGPIAGHSTRFDRRSHLVGDRHSLEIDICRFLSAGPSLAESTTADPPPVRVPEIVRVRYFLEGLDPLAEQYRETSIDEIEGLVRQELDWAATIRALDAPGTVRPTSNADQRNDVGTRREERVPSEREDESLVGASSVDPNHLFVPEAVWLELSYFDGSVWHEEWDSDQLGRWPVAVDVKLTIRPEDTSRHRATKSDEHEHPVDLDGLPTYRLVTVIQQARSAAPSEEGETQEGSGSRHAEGRSAGNVSLGGQR